MHDHHDHHETAIPQPEVTDRPRPAGRAHLHLDPLGGIAGDMFIAAMLDAAPDLIPEAQDLAARIGPGIGLKAQQQRDSGMRGLHLALTLPDSQRGPHHYADYRDLLAKLAPDAGIRARALDILLRLGQTEASVHGVTLEQVHFHEISDWDSIADILLAALCLERLQVGSASTAPLPLGGGRIQTEHGQMPVPAPATLMLMRGLPVIDDGIPGERVTPTGAAIMAHLAPALALPDGALRLDQVGHGLGTRRMQGIANLLRVGLWRKADAEASAQDVVGVIAFHIDDQTPEDLAVGLDRLRAMPEVLDVLQVPAIGKKGRMITRIEVICRRDAIDLVARAALSETTTIGLRMRQETRMILPRTQDTGTGGVGTKTLTRPDGTRSIKAEMDDLGQAGDHAARQRARRQAETPD
ncbi:LarC family nickel insertion protein [Paracoccus tegillarcae]|nr:LarC family nickel insertion protein [Paracoccus tegillarcae]